MADYADYSLGFLNQAYNVANTPYQQYTGQTVAGFNPYQTQAYDAQAQRAIQGSPVTSAAQSNITNTLNGNYLNADSNPYLTGAIQSAQQDLTNAWNNSAVPSWQKAMQGSGSFGNSGVMQASQNAASDYQKSLGNIATNMRFNAYNAERQNQMSALGLSNSIANQDYTDIGQLASAGQAYQNQNQNVLDSNYQQWMAQQQYPTNQLNTFGNALRAVNGSQTQSANPLAQLIGGASAGAGLYNLLFGG